jgi:hypothetical protein
VAVLVEAISVVIRRDAIAGKFHGGWDAFVKSVPNATLCVDEKLVRVGFMAQNDVRSYINDLERHGLKFENGGTAEDIVVVDQQSGPTLACDWVEFGQFPYGGDGGKVSACWFFDGPRTETGHQLTGPKLQIATPLGWTFEASMSKSFGFVPLGEEDKRLRFVRKEGPMEVYLDLVTGEEVYRGRYGQ